jgi:hypothetical protein
MSLEDKNQVKAFITIEKLAVKWVAEVGINIM